ncbi:MAG TPA: hypothetical protein VGM93_07725, partial [Acidimicrobiales bacterium]
QSTVWASAREISRSQAIQTLWWEWAGYRLGDRLLQTGITPDRGRVKAIKDRVLRTTYVSAYGLTDADMVRVLRNGQDRPWAHFGGFASSLDAFARAAKDAGVDGVRFDSAFSWGDKLYDHHRAHLLEQFHTPVFDTYGTGEGFAIAAQKGGRAYYVMSPHVVVELLDDHDQPVPAGEIGRVIVTRLDARSMPLVRFRLGDLAVAPATPFVEPGAPAFPQLERIVGRETDVVRSPGGRTLTVHTFTGVFEHIGAIRQFAVVPSAAGLTIEYIAAPDLDRGILDNAERALADAIGEVVPITWQPVAHIADAPSGKPQIIRPGRSPRP